jgi:hypothetical protein
MPSDVLSCPYCNSAVAPPPGARLGQRIPCPRCGESFPLRETVPDEAVTVTPPTAPPPPEIHTPRRISNGQMALLILGGMAVMALIGLAYALHTQELRRSYDVQLPNSRAIDVPLIARVALGLYVAGLIGAIVWGWNRRERAAGDEARPWTSRVGVPGLALLALVGIGLALLAIRSRPVRPPLDHPKIVAVAPAELAALGYLPDDTDMIVAAHVAEAWDNPTGRDLLQSVGLGGAGAPNLEKWTGLRLEDIDHAALGLKLDADLPTRFVLVVRARRPLDERRVREALKATEKQEVDGRTVYPFVLKTGLNFPAEIGVAAWFADDHTFVIAKKEEGFGRVPLTPKTSVDHLRPALRQVIKERMGSSAQAWLAAHVESWEGLNPFLRVGLANELGPGTDTFKKVRTLALWLAADDGVTLRGAFDCDDGGAAKALQAYLEPNNRKGVKTLFDPQDVGPMGREFLNSLKTTQEGSWVDLQAKATAAK